MVVQGDQPVKKSTRCSDGEVSNMQLFLLVHLPGQLLAPWPSHQTPASPNKDIDGNSRTCGKLQQAQTNRHPECTQKATTPMIWPQLLHFFLLQPRHDSVITSEKIGLSQETSFMTERLCAVQKFHAQLAAVPLSFL